MSQKSPIYWHQGLFLQPQHFQLSDQYQREMLEPLLRTIHPHLWGCASLSLANTALTNRRCEVDGGEFLFPDGTFTSLPGNAIVNSRKFDSEWLEADKPFTIYIGLRKLNSQGNNVTTVTDLSATTDITSRYVTEATPRDVKDLYSGDENAQVKSLTHVLRIIFENELGQHEDYMLIPIARVIREESDIVFDESFFPPVLGFAASDGLNRLVKEVRDDITGRMMQLAAYDTTETESSTAYDGTLMRYRLAGRTLSRYIPRLFHYTDQGSVHPWDVYGVLVELIGELSTFSSTVNVLGETKAGDALLPTYDHSNIGDSFHAAKNLLISLLNEITIGPQYLVEMAKEDVIYSSDVPAKFFEQSVDYYLIVTTSENFSSFLESLITTAKVAARERVDTLRDRSLPGIGLIHAPNPPAEMPRRPDSHYLRLDSHCDEWQAVERYRSIALYWDETPDDAKVELVIVRR